MTLIVGKETPAPPAIDQWLSTTEGFIQSATEVG
jgi:hypothetical protein